MIILNGTKINLERFKDNTLKCSLKSKFPTKGNSLVIPELSTIRWLYEGDEEVFALYALASELKDRGVGRIRLEIPYMPNARQDRRDDKVFTLKYLANLINSLNFETVSVFDPHSDVTMALLDRAHIMEDQKNFWTYFTNKIISQNDAVMFPDSGSAKRYEATDKDFIGFKHRGKDGEIDRFELLNFKEGTKKVVIVDDICSSGITFYHAAKALKERGVEEVTLLVSHCENKLEKDKVFKYIDRIYTTNSICKLKDERIHIKNIF